MRAYVRRGLEVALVVGGGIFFSANAWADDTSGADSLLGGNQVGSVVSIPVTVGGNAVSVLGDSHSSGSSASGGAGSSDAGSSSSTSGEDSAGGGNRPPLRCRSR
ncbi:hypothetical protein ATL31_1789 [Phycicoccus duodecadis]|uniref:Small secreted domain DUF320 n=1 Tax=Phycicoccus duodecadis TaxID=173053 RepID=A0A2N3YJE7_9MICO|nr:hypothetical protein ATL31_1789 [Phycicoccus duodecadis]